MATKTSIRQETFAREYVIDSNGTRAAIAAGYKESSATEQASRLLTKVKVQRIIQQLQAKRASKLEITAEKLDAIAWSIASANMADFVGVDEHGKSTGIDLSKLGRDQWAAVTEIREDHAGGGGDGERKLILRTTVKLGDKLKSVDILNRRLGYYPAENHNVTVTDGLADKMADIRSKVAVYAVCRP